MLQLTLKYHAYAELDKLELAKTLLNDSKGPLVDPKTVLGAEAISNGGKEKDIPS